MPYIPASFIPAQSVPVKHIDTKPPTSVSSPFKYPRTAYMLSTPRTYSICMYIQMPSPLLLRDRLAGRSMKKEGGRPSRVPHAIRPSVLHDIHDIHIAMGTHTSSIQPRILPSLAIVPPPLPPCPGSRPDSQLGPSRIYSIAQQRRHVWRRVRT